MPQPPAGGHKAVFQRAHKVVVEVHGLVVAVVFGIHLRVKACGLVFGVVQLAETVAKLAPGDVQLKALGDSGRLSLARASGEISVGCSMMKVGCHSLSSTISSKYSTCSPARVRVDRRFFSSFRPSFFRR